jgi:hypothetical protein
MPLILTDVTTVHDLIFCLCVCIHKLILYCIAAAFGAQLCVVLEPGHFGKDINNTWKLYAFF